MVIQMGIVAAQVVAADDAPLQQSLVDLTGRLGAADDEFFEEGLISHQVEAGDGRDLLGGVVSLVIAQLGHRAQPALAHGRQVSPGGKGAEGLVGADVGGGPLAADVLLASRQGQDKAPPPLGVHRLADQSPRHLAHVFLPTGEEAKIRPAEIEGIAQRLPLAHHDVGPVFARRREQAQGDGISVDDQQRSRRVYRLGQLLQLAGFRQLAEEVWILNDHAGGVVVELGVGYWVLEACPELSRRVGDCQVGAWGVGVQGGAVFRVYGGGDDDLAPFPARGVHCHDGCLGQAGGPIVVGGVGHIHAREGADHALILEDGLQRALADLRLVGGVGGVELRATDDVADHAGREVVVSPRAQETGIVVEIGVLLAHGPQFAQDLQLGQGRGKLKPRIAHALWHVQEEVADGLHPDLGQHRCSVGLSVGDVGH